MSQVTGATAAPASRRQRILAFVRPYLFYWVLLVFLWTAMPFFTYFLRHHEVWSWRACWSGAKDEWVSNAISGVIPATLLAWISISRRSDGDMKLTAGARRE